MTQRGPDQGYHPQIIVPTPGKMSGAPASLQPGPEELRNRSSRVSVVGAGLLDQLTPDRYRVYQRQVRVLGDASLYDTSLSPAKPFQFSLGSYEVPSTMGIFITEIELRVFTFSGVAARETEEVDPGNLTTNLGYSFTYGAESNPYDSLSDITPVLFAVGTRAPTVPFYAANAAINRTNPSGKGAGLFPFDGSRPGPVDGPVAVYIDPQSKTFQGLAYCFKPLEIPVAFFQFKVAGYQVDQNTASNLLKSIVALPSALLLAPSPLDAAGTHIPGALSQTPSRSGREGE